MKKSITKTDQGKAVVYASSVRIPVNGRFINKILCYDDSVVAPYSVHWDSIDNAGTEPDFPENFKIEDKRTLPGQYDVGEVTHWFGYLVFNDEEGEALRTLFENAYKESKKRDSDVLKKEARLLERVEGERGYKTRKNELDVAKHRASISDSEFFKKHHVKF